MTMSLQERVSMLERRVETLERGMSSEAVAAFGLRKDQIRAVFNNTVMGDEAKIRRRETGLTGYELFASDLEALARDKGWTPPAEEGEDLPVKLSDLPVWEPSEENS